MNDWKSLHQQAERQIRSGQIKSAAALLKTVVPNQVPREWRMPLANLARRTRLINLGLRLLNPIVRPVIELTVRPAHADELIEYAILLERSGATSEAMDLLSTIDSDAHPESLFGKFSCHFSRWEYSTAVPFLKRYLKLAPNEYTRLIARVNLSAALIATGEYAEALEQLAMATERAAAAGALRLRANCLELRAQCCIAQGDYSAARFNLNESELILSAGPTRDSLHVSKWQAFLSALESRSLSPIEAFRVEALRRKDWESVRECDLYALKITYDEKIFDRLYFGTPYESYRRRIEQETGHAPRTRLSTIGEAGPAAPIFDLASGMIDRSMRTNDATVLPGRGQKTHQLLEFLLRDLYSPVRTGSIFGEMFPDEYFDVFSSPQRVRQLVYRARRILNAAGLPLTIAEEDGRYSAKLGELFVRVSLDRRKPSNEEFFISRIQSQFGTRPFTNTEVRALLGLSAGSSQRFLAWAIGAGQANKLGKGPATVYVLTAAATAA